MEDINEEIENLEEYINFKKQFTLLDNEQERLEALEHLIKAYKELEEENQQLEAIKDEAIKRYNFESIPVSLVEEKIEEYTKLLKNCNRFSDVDRIKAINERILACKELLEKRK